MRSEKDLLDSAKKYSFRGRVDKTVFAGPVFVRGEGSTVEDVNGKQYLDFNSGQMCSALGHNHPTVTDAIKKSCDELIHAHSSFFNDQEIILAERLGALLPPPLEKSLFLGSGADANEAAVTIARKFTDGFEVASPHISFHGLSDTAQRARAAVAREYGHGRALLLPLPARPEISRLRDRLPGHELRTHRRADDEQARRRHHRTPVQRGRGGRASARMAQETQRKL
ncbi:MAG: aminotransferase class III-fold pyridoxal phosphate-dependent enzyme [Nitrospinae bacterium]|nr:aminotransferase class III-fold pyridoxal phosphate-dependent enzyme [Nitrospinota bacterium]